jgi:quercetin dioxygenase-like cupin family protein
MKNFHNFIVRKPWGQEYLCYQNEELAIWLLHIKEGHKTSFHCHPNKNTGFIVLGGEVELSFMRNQLKLSTLDKIHIFRARFHSTRAVSPGGAFVMEIETPEDKHDLVRLEDAYGRKDEAYEGLNHHFPKDETCLWIEEPDTKASTIKIAEANLLHIKPSSKSELFAHPESVSFVVTRGGIAAGQGQKLLYPGDIVDGSSLERLLQAFNLVDGSTFIRVQK